MKFKGGIISDTLCHNRNMKCLLPILLTLPFTAFAGTGSNYAECLLDNMPGIANEQSHWAGLNMCRSAHPQQFSNIEKGSGQGFFSKQSPEQCTLTKARDTRWQYSANMIRAACDCLYGDATRKGETCAGDPLIDPLEFIKKHGHTSVKKGQGKETGTLYTYNEEASGSRIKNLTRTIKGLYQAPGANEFCEFIGGQGKTAIGANSLTVLASGYRGDVLACSLLYDAVTQIAFYREDGNLMYTYFVVLRPGENVFSAFE